MDVCTVVSKKCIVYNSYMYDIEFLNMKYVYMILNKKNFTFHLNNKVL